MFSTVTKRSMVSMFVGSLVFLVAGCSTYGGVESQLSHHKKAALFVKIGKETAYLFKDMKIVDVKDNSLRARKFCTLTENSTYKLYHHPELKVGEDGTEYYLINVFEFTKKGCGFSQGYVEKSKVVSSSLDKPKAPSGSSSNIVATDRCEWGEASEYGHNDGYQGRRTANGEIFETYRSLTAAHKTLPFGTKVKVSLQHNPNISVVVRINDRGPFAKGRIIDLTRFAHSKLGVTRPGLSKVKVCII